MFALVNHRLLMADDKAGESLVLPRLGAAVVVADSAVVAVLDEDKLEDEYPDCPIVDLQGKYLAPGFIDLQVGALIFWVQTLASCFRFTAQRSSS